MSRKNRKTKKQKLRRPGMPGYAPEDFGAATTQPSGGAPTAAVASNPPAYAGGITGPRRQVAATGALAAGNIDIDARVPYFSRDLRRIFFTAVVMIALIVAVSYAVR